MANKQPSYLAYMLRLWRVDNQGEPIWRASLESPHTGERQSFADIDKLFSFLQEKIHTQFAGHEQPDERNRSE